MLCPYCGGSVPEGSAFCPYCRGKIEPASFQPQAQQQVSPQVQPQVQSQTSSVTPVIQQRFAPPTTAPPLMDQSYDAWQGGAPAPAPTSNPAPVPVLLPLQAPASYAPLQPSPSQDSKLPDNPQRALVLAGSMLAALLLLSFIPSALGSASGQFGTAYLSIMRLVPLACAVFFIQREGIFNKLLAMGIGLAATVLYCIAFLSVVADLQQTGSNVLALILGVGVQTFMITLVSSAVVIAIGLFAAALSKGNPQLQVLLTALFVGGAFFATQLVINLIVGLGRAYLPSAFFTPLLQAAALSLALVLVFLLCRFKSTCIVLSTGHKVWFWLCAVATSLSLLAAPALFVLTSGTQNLASQLSSPHLLSLLCSTTALIGYVYLLRAKRIGFILVLLGCGITLFGQLGFNVVMLTTGLAQGSLSGNALGAVVASLFSSLTLALNPAITSLVLLSAWKTSVPEQPQTLGRIALVFKIAAPLALALGTILFLNACLGYFGLWSHTLRNPVVFYLGVVLCGAIAFTGLCATIGCFVPRAKAPKPLLIASTVLAAFCALFCALILFIGSSPFTGA